MNTLILKVQFGQRFKIPHPLGGSYAKCRKCKVEHTFLLTRVSHGWFYNKAMECVGCHDVTKIHDTFVEHVEIVEEEKGASQMNKPERGEIARFPNGTVLVSMDWAGHRTGLFLMTPGNKCTFSEIKFEDLRTLGAILLAQADKYEKHGPDIFQEANRGTVA